MATQLIKLLLGDAPKSKKRKSPAWIDELNEVGRAHAKVNNLEDQLDVSIVVAGVHTFKGHRAVLSRIPYFAAAFREGFAEHTTKRIEIHDVSFETFNVVWHAFYSDQVDFVAQLQDDETLRGVVVAAQRFEMRSLSRSASTCEVELDFPVELWLAYPVLVFCSGCEHYGS